jgi:sulfur-oxidizing protein SoxY
MKIETIKSWILVLLLAPALALAANDDADWTNKLKDQYFAGKSIEESSDVIEIDAPYRAEDPALVPIKIVSKVPQTRDSYIKKILVLVDKNPFRLSASLNSRRKAARPIWQCGSASIPTATSVRSPK